MSRRYSLQIAPEKPFFDANHVGHVIPARVISFENGRYSTTDPVVIEAIRNSNSYKQKMIVEVTEADRDMFRLKSEQRVLRGPVGTASLRGEPDAVHPVTAKPADKYRSKCDVPGCGKEFKNDIGGKALRLHMMWHRRQAAQQGVTVEEK
jgi:hypothetical protein